VSIQRPPSSTSRRALHHPTHAQPALLRHIAGLDPKAWRTVALDRDGRYRKPQVVDEQAALSAYTATIRQLVVRRLGRDATTGMSPSLSLVRPR
jgi:hypothetical protein